jgi:hypothetical protein
MKRKILRICNKNSISLCLAITAMFLLNGCSSNIWTDLVGKQSDKPISQEIESSTNSDYKQHLSEWQTLKPSIERLVAIESELTIMIEQLTDIIDNQNSTVEMGSMNRLVTSESQSVRSSRQIESVVMPPTKQPQKIIKNTTLNNILKTSSKNYAVQLFSLRDAGGLKSNLETLINKHPLVLATLEAIVEEVSVANTMYYRMKVGNFDNQNDANEVCARLQLLQTTCMVVNANGVKFE